MRPKLYVFTDPSKLVDNRNIENCCLDCKLIKLAWLFWGIHFPIISLTSSLIFDLFTEYIEIQFNIFFPLSFHFILFFCRWFLTQLLTF